MFPLLVSLLEYVVVSLGLALLRKTHAISIIAGFAEILYVSGEACLALTTSMDRYGAGFWWGSDMPDPGALVRCPVDFESRRRAERTRVELAGPLRGCFLGQPGQSFFRYPRIAQVIRQIPCLGQFAQASR